MKIAEKIIQLMGQQALEHTIKHVQVGLIYSAVELDNSTAGVAYTFPRGSCRNSDSLKRQMPLSGKRASELIIHLAGGDLIDSSIAMATVNALLSSTSLPPEAQAGDILGNLDIRTKDRVCMVGCFLPVMKTLKEKQVAITAVDEVPKPGSRPAEEVRELLPDSQVAIITATSIINNTIDSLLELSVSCRQVAILGPSSPLLREAFYDTPVSLLAGIRVINPKRVIQIIGEGGGFREFKGYTQKVNVPIG